MAELLILSRIRPLKADHPAPRLISLTRRVDPTLAPPRRPVPVPCAPLSTPFRSSQGPTRQQAISRGDAPLPPPRRPPFSTHASPPSSFLPPPFTSPTHRKTMEWDLIPFDQLVWGEKLGQGSFGVVCVRPLALPCTLSPELWTLTSS